MVLNQNKSSQIYFFSVKPQANDSVESKVKIEVI